MTIRRPATAQTIRARVLRAIAAQRRPGLHFPGHLLDIAWHRVAGGGARATLAAGPHCCRADGTVDIVALAILADQALAAAVRTVQPPGIRMGTTHLHLQFTGDHAAGDIEARSCLLGGDTGGRLPRTLAAATLSAAGVPFCHASGEFALLDPLPGVPLGPLPWEREESPTPAPEDPDPLAPHEAAILAACDRALAKVTPRNPFIGRLWGGAPRRTASGASARVAIGPHMGNRVGHVQGGILLGLAATAAAKAAPAGAFLANVSAWYLTPGRGEALRIGARLLHSGRATAVVRTGIRTPEGTPVLEAVSRHVLRP